MVIMSPLLTVAMVIVVACASATAEPAIIESAVAP